MEHVYYYYTCDRCGKASKEQDDFATVYIRGFGADKEAKIIEGRRDEATNGDDADLNKIALSKVQTEWRKSNE
ncbi:MAG: hypothetical protein ACI4W2_04805 [Eubacterium sp.]